MVARTRKRGFDSIVASGNNLPFENNSFDMVVAGTWVFKYLDRTKALNECKRVMQDGGTLAFDLPFFPAHTALSLLSILRYPPRLWREAYKDCYLGLDGRWVPSWRRALRNASFKPLDIIGGMQSPIFRSRFGYSRQYRSKLALPLCEVIWFAAEYRPSKFSIVS